MKQAATAFLGFEDYLAGEAARGSEGPRREWFDTVVYKVPREEPEHARLAFRVGRAIANALPAPYEVYSSEMRLYIPAANLSTYADVSVVCGAVETAPVRDNSESPATAVVNPTIIVEVLSESTERYDRDGKFQAYKRIPSLEEYVLVSQYERKVEVFRRENDFRGDVATSGDTFVLRGTPVAVDDVYGAEPVHDS